MDKLITDDEAYYKGPDLTQEVINKDKDITVYRLPVDAFANEEAKQRFAEFFLSVELGMTRGIDYISATVSDEGQVVFQPIKPIRYLEFNLGVARKDEDDV